MILAVLFDFTSRVRPFSACFCLFDASGQLLLVHSIIGLPNLCSDNVSLLLIVVLELHVSAPAGSWIMRIWLCNPDF